MIRAALTAVLLAAGGAVALPAAPAEAAACSSTTGVTVVVDFTRAGGGIQVGCASSYGTGLQALTSAGFSYTTVKNQPFVCKINSAPASAGCQRTPPTTAYWSYWHAPRGGAWSYYTSGAGSSHPVKGQVEGWSFGSGQQPGIAPPAPAPTAAPTTRPPTAKPTTPRPPTQGPKPTTARPTVITSRPSSTSTAPGTTPGRPTARTTPPTDAPATSTTPGEPTTDGSPPATSDPQPVSEPAADDGGSPTGAIVGLAAVVVLGGAAGTAAYVRKRKA